MKKKKQSIVSVHFPIASQLLLPHNCVLYVCVICKKYVRTYFFRTNTEHVLKEGRTTLVLLLIAKKIDRYSMEHELTRATLEENRFGLSSKSKPAASGDNDQPEDKRALRERIVRELAHRLRGSGQ